MRMIGALRSEREARTLSDHLYAVGIETQIESDAEDHWQVWVVAEEHLDRAREILARFVADPRAPEFADAAARAAERRRSAARESQQRRDNYIPVARRWAPLGSDRPGPVTLALIAVSVAVSLYSGLGRNTERVMPLHITAYRVLTVAGGRAIEWRSDLPEVRRGQVWRIWTPMFIHYGLLHIIFNMWWLKDLGSMIERRRSAVLLLALVVVIGAASNLVQYANKGSPLNSWLGYGPAFGGMSGVVYGLLGFIWMRGRYDPRSSLHLNGTLVTMMIIWFLVCLFGLIGHVANGAHAAGLAAGMLWGFLSSPKPWRALRRAR